MRIHVLKKFMRSAYMCALTACKKVDSYLRSFQLPEPAPPPPNAGMTNKKVLQNISLQR